MSINIGKKMKNNFIRHQERIRTIIAGHPKVVNDWHFYSYPKRVWNGPFSRWTILLSQLTN